MHGLQFFSNTKTFQDQIGDMTFIQNSEILTKEQITFMSDAAVAAVQRELVAIQDLDNAGCVHNMDDLSKLRYSYQQTSDVSTPDTFMEFTTDVAKDTFAQKRVNVPIPILAKEFELGQRTALGSQNPGGVNIELKMLETASFAVGEAIERLLFNGAPGLKESSGDALYGLRTHPERLTFTLSGGSNGWNGVSGVNILSDVSKMLTELGKAGFSRNFVMYASKSLSLALQQDYKPAGSDKTFLKRIEDFFEIDRVVLVDNLADNEIILLRVHPSTVTVEFGAQPTIVEWGAKGSLIKKYMIFAAVAPVIQSDFYGKCGVLHATPS